MHEAKTHFSRYVARALEGFYHYQRRLQKAPAGRSSPRLRVVKLLLDTHIFLWWTVEPEKLPEDAMALIGDPTAQILLRAASTWEIRIKADLSRLELQEPLRNIVEREISANGFRLLPITFEHTERLFPLPPLHGDPFDRILIAQAVAEEAELVTTDAAIRAYPGVPVRFLG